MDAKAVGAVATLTGVSVRTLHHYDHMGLVVPSVRTPAGYRGYTDAEEQVEIFSTTGFGSEYAAEAEHGEVTRMPGRSRSSRPPGSARTTG